ncbi:MAG: HAD family hydrolase [Ornithinibacter sp.]
MTTGSDALCGETPAPRVIATDLDGTLLRSDGTVSPRTARALRRAEDAGLSVVFVTARPPRWIEALREYVGGHGTVIAGNGAFVMDLLSGTVEEYGFDGAALLTVARALRDAFPDVGLAVERRTGMAREVAFASPHGEDALTRTVPLLEHLDDLDEVPTGKLLAAVPDHAGSDFLDAVSSAVGEQGIVAYSGVGHLAEISAPGVTKAAALARWCEERGVGSEAVWAFGDMPNDLPMLAWAGVSFAMASGHPEVIAAASHGCPANDEDGVAAVIEALLTRSRLEGTSWKGS